MSILKADKILRPDGETLLDTTGSVLQTQSAHITAYASTTSSSYVTLGSYQVSITLSHADNKVLVMGGWYGATSGSYNRAEYAMYRGSTIINLGDSHGRIQYFGYCVSTFRAITNPHRSKICPSRIQLDCRALRQIHRNS